MTPRTRHLIIGGSAISAVAGALAAAAVWIVGLIGGGA